MTYTQANRPYKITTPLGNDVLLLAEFTGEEQVASLYRWTVRAWSTKTTIAPSELLLKAVSLSLQLPEGGQRTVHGVVSRFAQTGSARDDLVEYELEIVPPHWVLALEESFEIFQNKSVRDICGDLLKGTPFEWKLVRTLDPRPYCFRYRESRWACASRLLEQEGIWYRFDNSGSEAKLVLADTSASAQPAWNTAQLVFDTDARREGRLMGLTMQATPFVGETRVRSASEFLATRNVGNVVASGGEFKPPADAKAYLFEQQLTAHRSGITHSGGDSASDASKLPDDTKVYARLRQEQAESLAVVYRGTSTYVGLQSGAKTKVTAHPAAALNVELFVLGVTHRGSNGSYFSGGGQASYENSFEAIPAGTPYRPPRRTPWPRVAGSHVGTVVGPEGEEIYTDKHGRVQVVFKWDLDDSRKLDRSCWIRVAQPFAGQNFGAVFLPRIGHEVIVDFLDGDPDNPVVVGSLYNGANLPPWKLPDNKTQSGVRTKSTLKGGADNFNELRFEDKKGEELVYVQAEKDLTTLVKNDETRDVRHNRTTTITNDDVRTVKEGVDTHTIEKGKQTITVADNDREISVAKNQMVTIGENHTVSIGKDQTTDIGENDTTTVGSNLELTVGSNASITVGSNQETSVGSKRTETVGADAKDTIGGKYEIKVDGSAMTVTSAMKIELKVGGSSIIIDMSGVTIKAPMIKIEGQAMAQIKAPMTQVNGDAMVMIKGGITMIN
ncbi:type VI secretion system Vgr family protein [Gemmatimonas sp. UBA7669]|uniref:type VI secretion system Vgr family protein n=1 Tax=Gemmatimonas sp. UBA7669 TaxID=1946568 RepID=UPI0025B8A8F4|nr:type VI secretion system tip protein TssI/VgrG [Gemmatimonas sp. UBA7669]